MKFNLKGLSYICGYLWGPEKKNFWRNQELYRHQWCLPFVLQNIEFKGEDRAEKWGQEKIKHGNEGVRDFNLKKLAEKVTFSLLFGIKLKNEAVPLALSPFLCLLKRYKVGLFGSGSEPPGISIGSPSCPAKCCTIQITMSFSLISSTDLSILEKRIDSGKWIKS